MIVAAATCSDGRHRGRHDRRRSAGEIRERLKDRFDEVTRENIDDDDDGYGEQEQAERHPECGAHSPSALPAAALLEASGEMWPDSDPDISAGSYPAVATA
jgi:hypothetical protein